MKCLPHKPSLLRYVFISVLLYLSPLTFHLSPDVRIGGLEPPLLSEQDPKSCAATNYAISAWLFFRAEKSCKDTHFFLHSRKNFHLTPFTFHLSCSPFLPFRTEPQVDGSSRRDVLSGSPDGTPRRAGTPAAAPLPPPADSNSRVPPGGIPP